MHEPEDAGQEEGNGVRLVEEVERDVVDRPVVDGVERLANDVFGRALTPANVDSLCVVTTHFRRYCHVVTSIGRSFDVKRRCLSVVKTLMTLDGV